MVELLGMKSTLSSSLLPVIAPDMVLSKGQIEVFEI